MISSRRLLLAFTALVVVPVVAHAKIERRIEKTFALAPGAAGTLRIESQGAIKVKGSSDATVKIVARERIRADSETEADDLLKKLDLRMEQAGSDIVIVSKYERQPSGFRFASWPPVQVDFEVWVPTAFSAELRTAGGGIEMDDVGGRIDARTSGGGITLGSVGGPVKAHTSGGGISLREAKADVDLDTSGGGINVGRVAGAANLETSGGGIRIEAVERAVRAHTSGGSIQASVVGPLREDSSLSTSGGSVTLTVDKTAAFRLDASTSGGGVHADGLTITLEGGKPRGDRLAGAVNGGGPLLKLRSSGGGVTVRAR